MVAISVILAAVIAVFVLDIGPGDATISAAADVSDGEESNEVDVEITSGGGDLDGIALVGPDGNVVNSAHGVNTGSSETLEVDNWDDYEDGDEFTVYGYAGSEDVVDDGTIDDADAHANLGSIELTDPDQ